jgi:hypothetical protein
LDLETNTVPRPQLKPEQQLPVEASRDTADNPDTAPFAPTPTPYIRPVADIMGRVSFAEDTKLPQDTEIEEPQSSVFAYQDGPENRSWAGALPLKQGLYDPELEKDAWGVGFAA